SLSLQSGRCLSVLQLLLVTLSAREAREIGGGSFLEDEQQWLSAVHRYSRTVKHWNRFRDVSYRFKTTTGNVVCVCVCVSETVGLRLFCCVCCRIRESGLKPHADNCKLCSETPSTPVCGSDGHNYASQCKLEQQACLSGKDLSVLCSGSCPCINVTRTQTRSTHTHYSIKLCTGQDLADLGDRLRDWFQLLHGNAKQNNSGRQSTASVFDRGLVAGCKDSIGWMFSRLDTSNDLFLDQSELAAVNLEKYEVCIRPFFNSCDSYRDGKVSTAEWCLCFWRESECVKSSLENYITSGPLI
uniref:SPARC (osteonectin), cwcv and kazal like domains proteoglycan 2 n=1 Tax=Sinocyclocheilus grahami TaxID=75366 RepID=A0A672PPQ0_SINGR